MRDIECQDDENIIITRALRLDEQIDKQTTIRMSFTLVVVVVSLRNVYVVSVRIT